MTIKFKEKVCECGLDLTTAEPVKVRGGMPVGNELVTLGECPKCHTNRIMVEPKPVVVPEPEPELPRARSGRRKASKPLPEE